MQFLSEAGERAIEQAIAAIEAVSSAEVVVAIRPRARHSLLQHAAVGIVAALGILAFTLYSPIDFSLWQILVLPMFAGLAGALLVEAVPPLYRWTAPAWLRYEHVREAAYAAFIEREVHGTRERTGVLVYIALRERMVEIVGDLAVARAHGIEELAAWAGTLEARIPGGAEAFGKELAALAPALAKSLPRRTDEGDGLRNRVQGFSGPPRHRKGARGGGGCSSPCSGSCSRRRPRTRGPAAVIASAEEVAAGAATAAAGATAARVTAAETTRHS